MPTNNPGWRPMPTQHVLRTLRRPETPATSSTRDPNAIVAHAKTVSAMSNLRDDNRRLQARAARWERAARQIAALVTGPKDAPTPAANRPDRLPPAMSTSTFPIPRRR